MKTLFGAIAVGLFNLQRELLLQVLVSCWKGLEGPNLCGRSVAGRGRPRRGSEVWVSLADSLERCEVLDPLWISERSGARLPEHACQETIGGFTASGVAPKIPG